MDAFTHKLHCAGTIKLEPITDRCKLICMSSQYVADNNSASSSSSCLPFLYI